MAVNQSSKSSGIENILMDTVEIQLATFNAGIKFWSQWVVQTTQLSKTLEKKLDTFKKKPNKPADVLVEITETSREYLRKMSGLPKDVARKFINEVGRLQKKRHPVKKKTSAKPRRRARAKI